MCYIATCRSHFGTDPSIMALSSPSFDRIRFCIRMGIISSVEDYVLICRDAQRAIDTGTWRTWSWTAMDRQGLVWTLDLDHHYQHHDQFHIELGFPQESARIQPLGRHTCFYGCLAQTPSTHLVLCTLSGPLAIMPLSSDDAIRVWNLTEMVRIAGSCKLQGFEVAIHSSPVKKLVYIGLYGTQLAVPDGRILYARNHLTVYKSRACLVFLEPDQETRVGEMLRKALADHNFVVAGEAVPIHRDDSPHRMLLNGHIGSQLATRLAQVHAWIRNITGPSSPAVVPNTISASTVW